MTNTGDAPLMISTFRATGPDAADFGVGAICPVRPGQLRRGWLLHDLRLVHARQPRPKSATLAIGDDAPASPQTVDAQRRRHRRAAGPPARTCPPAALAFGDEIVNTKSEAQAVTLVEHRRRAADDLDLPPQRPRRGRLRAGRRLPGQPRLARLRARRARSTSRSRRTARARSRRTLVIGDDASCRQPVCRPRAAPAFSAPADATLAPASLTFADRTVGTTSDAQAVTVTNTGPGPARDLHRCASTGPQADDFAQGVDCPVSPDTLAAGASCTIYVSFTPHSGGLKNASLVIGDNAPSSPRRFR